MREQRKERAADSNMLSDTLIPVHSLKQCLEYLESNYGSFSKKIILVKVPKTMPAVSRNELLLIPENVLVICAIDLLR